MAKHMLGLANVGLVASPGLLGGLLESTAIREGQGPGQAAHGVHEAKVESGLLLGLAARQEGNARDLFAGGAYYECMI